MNVCPICEVDRPARGADGKYARQDVMRWLVSCASCGWAFPEKIFNGPSPRGSCAFMTVIVRLRPGLSART